MDSSGEFVWVKNLGFTRGTCGVNSKNEIIVSGYFSSNVLINGLSVDNNGFNDFFLMNLSNDVASNVEDANKVLDIRISPNPVGQSSQINFGSNNVSLHGIEIYDSFGRFIYRSEVSIGESSLLLPSSMKKGLFYLIFRTKNGEYIPKKMYVN